MPTYQYACTNADCGNRFELVQSFTDPAASECPECTGAVRKVYGSVGVVFKGSGFYRTDSRSSTASTAESKSGSSDSGAAKSGSTGDSSSTPTSTGSSSSSGSTGSGAGPSKVAASA